MLGPFRDYLKRSWLPSAVIATSRARTPAYRAARIARKLGRPVTMEIYFAFDDPYAAIAVPALRAMVQHKPVAVALYPIIGRGIPDDPAQAARDVHALIDAKRLALRRGTALRRSAPLDADDSRFLACWTAAAGQTPQALAFAADALDELWRQSDGPIDRAPFERLYRTQLSGSPPAETALQLTQLRDNERRLRSKGHWESPVVRVAGEWFFAHERLALVSRRLVELCA